LALCLLPYTQDERGYLSDETIGAVWQKKTRLTELEVRNVIRYTPAAHQADGQIPCPGLHQLRCILLGGDESWTIASKLGIGHKRRTLTELFPEESSPRRMQLAPQCSELRLSEI